MVEWSCNQSKLWCHVYICVRKQTHKQNNSETRAHETTSQIKGSRLQKHKHTNELVERRKKNQKKNNLIKFPIEKWIYCCMPPWNFPFSELNIHALESASVCFIFGIFTKCNRNAPLQIEAIFVSAPFQCVSVQNAIDIHFFFYRCFFLLSILKYVSRFTNISSSSVHIILQQIIKMRLQSLPSLRRRRFVCSKFLYLLPHLQRCSTTIAYSNVYTCNRFLQKHHTLFKVRNFMGFCFSFFFFFSFAFFL